MAYAIRAVAGKERSNKMKPTIYIIGDSTAGIKTEDKRPESGWGEHLYRYFSTAVKIDNRALNGRSTKSFREEGHFEEIQNLLNEQDFLIIQFGHNDQKVDDPSRFTEPSGAFKENLAFYVEAAKQKGAQPILLTPMTRRRFENNQIIFDEVEAYYQATKEVAEKLHVPMIDMLAITIDLMNRKGEEQSKSLYLHLEPGEHPNYPEGVTDNTHFNETGANTLASLVAQQLNEQVSALAPYYSN